MSRCKLLCEEETGRLNNNVYAKSAPGNVCRILLCKTLNLVAVYDKLVAINFDVVLELAMN